MIQPEDVDAFLLPLPVDRLPGVGRVTEEKLKAFIGSVSVSGTSRSNVSSAEMDCLGRVAQREPDCENRGELTEIALSLRERVALAPQKRFRLVGVGLSNFFEPDSAQAVLFG